MKKKDEKRRKKRLFKKECEKMFLMDVRDGSTRNRFDRGKKVKGLNENGVRGAIHITHTNDNGFFVVISIHD